MLDDISSLFWGKEAFNGAKIRDYSKREGVNPRDFEKQIWEYDTLFVLKEFSDLDLFFKGGTCVQFLLPLNFQRFSVDLDFNIETKYKINQIFGDKTMIQDVVKAIEVSLKNKEYSRYMHALPKEVAPLIRDRMFYTKLIDVIAGI